MGYYNKRKKLDVLYKDELQKIVEIIRDDSIIDKNERIAEIADEKKIAKSLKKGMYLDFDSELGAIKEYYGDFKNGQFSEKNMKKRLYELVYLNTLYENDVLNEKTYYPIFKKLTTRYEDNNYYSYLKKSKNLDLADEEIQRALKNVEEIDKNISQFHEGQTLKNLKYRKTIEKFLEEDNYLENYNYSEVVVNNYINYDKSYLKYKFLNKSGINSDTFDSCVKIIKFLNPELYEKYEEKKEQNEKKLPVVIKSSFSNLAYAIVNGEFRDGSEFNLLEFYKKIPLKNSGVGGINQYLNKNFGFDSLEYNSIMKYIHKNNVYFTWQNEQQAKKNNGENHVVNGININNQLIHSVYNYMKNNDYPNLRSVYSIILDKAINGEIDLYSVKANTSDNEKFNNPYVFVKK